MSIEINPNRRRFLGTAAMTIAAAQLGMFGCAIKRRTIGGCDHDSAGDERVVWPHQTDRCRAS